MQITDAVPHFTYEKVEVRGGVAIHQDRPPPDLRNLSVLVLRGRYASDCGKKTDRALQYTIIKRLAPMSESYPLENNPGFGGQGGVDGDPPLTSEFQVVGLGRIGSGHMGAWDRS